MALIRCPECNREISDRAGSCPECAYPLAATTIEQTGKRWKQIQFGATALMVMGIPTCFAGGETGAAWEA